MKGIILLAAAILNLMVFGVGAWFFYDLVLAPKLGLHSPEKLLQTAETIILSPVREPDEQIESITTFFALRDQVEASVWQAAYQRIDDGLPKRVVARIVLDAWIAHRQQLLPPSQEPSYSDPAAAIRSWQNTPADSRLRQAMYMDPQLQCDPDLYALAVSAVENDDISELEKAIAGQVLARFADREAYACRTTDAQ